ncbi:MAG: cobalamin biosynthesis protein [Proteobacteria bacterium]|nr:cobalamin biosynthesis protein [Pseudomonadota bacterium]
MKIALVAITRGGKKLARQLADRLDGATLLTQAKGQKVAELIAASWQSYDGLICIMAAGIAVRAIAPLLQDKLVDPCVVVMDEKGRHAISLLSGHMGGGNDLARKVAILTGGAPVITTASDTLQLVALDLWAEGQGLLAPGREKLTEAASLLVNFGSLRLYSDETVTSLPTGLTLVGEVEQADIIVSTSTRFEGGVTIFRPRNLVVGIGCNRGTPAGEMEEALTELLTDLQLSKASIRNLASIDKKNDEPGLLQFAADNGWQIEFFPSEQINTLNNVAISFAALKAVGAIGVAEPAALLSAQSNHLLSRKRKWKNVTMAIVRAPFLLSAQDPEQ